MITAWMTLRVSMRSNNFFIFPIIVLWKPSQRYYNWSPIFCFVTCIVVYTFPLLFSWVGSKLEYESWDQFRVQTIWELCAAFWGREASRKWEWASLQTVWGVVEGRMLIKIINNCWKEKWITTPLSDQPGELPEPRLPLSQLRMLQTAKRARRSAAQTFLRTDRTTFQTA